MKLLILLVSFVVVASASDYEQWRDFKEKFSKTHDLTEDGLRYKIFQSNLRKIENHNDRYEKGEVSYFLKVTEFADWTSEEFQELLKAQLATEPNVKPIGTFKSESSFTRPDSIDWREKNAVLKVKNQGTCGSCWAFSATGSLEGQLAIHRNQQISLSEQELVSCSQGSCRGGFLDSTFDYVRHNGLSSEEQYPYEEDDGECRTDLTDKPISSLQGYVLVDRNEEGIADAVASVGPISIYVTADSDWQLYGGGIFDHETCGDSYNHAVLIVGYDAQAWTIKNSWGESWGENGYLRLIQGKNQCGISTFPIYPVL